jgi:hypothetical protein
VPQRFTQALLTRHPISNRVHPMNFDVVYVRVDDARVP